MTTPATSSSRWLFGPVPDLLLGCGLLHASVIAVYAGAGDAIRATHPSFLFIFLVMLFSMPHYGATLVRVYDQRSERRRYAFFSVYATLAVLALFLAGLHSNLVGSILLTVYLTWSPWHYTGQNYGLAVMFLRRRGVAPDGWPKRLLYASFLLSYVLVFLVFHADRGAVSYDAVTQLGGSITLLSLGVPSTLGDVLFALTSVAYLACLVGATVGLRQRGSWSDLGPAAMLVATQALWFTIPYAVRMWGINTGIEPLDQQFAIRDYVFFIAFGHSLQYLWITTYYASESEGWNGTPRYLAKAAAAGIAVWTLPVILFAPDALGPRAYDAGLAMVLASVINIHHFILDGAIWKLRNSKIAEILIRAPEPRTLGVLRKHSGVARRLVWSGAAGGIAVALFGFYELEIGFPASVGSGDYASAVATLDRLAWIGRDDARRREALSESLARRGQVVEAISQLERATSLKRDPELYVKLARLHEHSGDWDRALRAYEEGLELEPGHVALLRGAGISWRRLERQGARSGSSAPTPD